MSEQRQKKNKEEHWKLVKEAHTHLPLNLQTYQHPMKKVCSKLQIPKR